MKKIFLLAFLALTTIIYSQELDEDYLQSLPEDIRSDVLNKIEAKENLDKPVYRRASTFIDKDINTTLYLGQISLMSCKHHLCQSMNQTLIPRIS